MRYNVITYLLGEGFRNVFKNKKSTSASLIIMCLTMIIFGIFFVIGENVTSIMAQVEGAQGIQVFIKNEATDDQVKAIGEKLRKIDGVNSIEFVSKQDALNQMKDQFKEKEYLLAGYEENNIFPASYVVTLTDLSKSGEVQTQMQGIDEQVKKISSKDETITTLINLANGVRIATGVILVFLVVISIFIISNTIKLTVHARRREISIMKFVGATNGFIRWPFIVEGMIIGILSGLFSILILGGAYSLVTQKIVSSQVISSMNISLVGFSDMFGLVVLVYLALGIGIGVVGSMISMRKYLKV